MEEEKSEIKNDNFGILNLVGYIFLVVIVTAGIIYAFRSNKTTQPVNQETIANATPVVENSVVTSELKTEDIIVGTGTEAVDGKTLSVHYVGTLMDGTKFDSSRDRNQPFEFVLGQGEVIAGWDIGLKGMKVGGKRKLTIPSDLGYGPQGAGEVIPPNSTLIFEVELIEVK